MKRTMVTLMVSLLVLAGTLQAQTPCAQLTGIGYNVREGKSLLTLQCASPVLPQVEELGQKVVLHFTGMTVAASPGEANFPFVSGSIASVSIRKEGPSELRVIVELRAPGLEYSISSGGTGPVLSVTGPVTPGPKAVAPTAATKAAVASVLPAPVTATMKAPAPAERKIEAAETASLSVPAMILAVLASALSTAGVVIILRRKANRAAVTPARPADDSSAHPDEGGVFAHACLVPPKETAAIDELQEAEIREAAIQEDEAQEEELSRDQTDAIAFRRMQAELGLVRTMSGASVSRRKAEELRALDGSDGNPDALKKARRLGVGRGEIALATRLGKLRTIETKPEEVAE
jgi:hypothetical protein